MALIKTSELKGKALDYAVALCEGEDYLEKACTNGIGMEFEAHEYSTNPAQAWPIIERERITLNSQQFDKQWIAYSHMSKLVQIEYGETSLIAAMRCYVASVKGEVIEIPLELI